MKKVAQLALIAAIAPAPLVGSFPVIGGAELDVAGGVGDEAGLVVDVLGLLLQAASARPIMIGSAAAIRRGCRG